MCFPIKPTQRLLITQFFPWNLLFIFLLTILFIYLFFLSKEELMRNTDSVIWGFSGGTTTPEIDETQK